jgi:hypothetical protein
MIAHTYHSRDGGPGQKARPYLQDRSKKTGHLAQAIESLLANLKPKVKTQVPPPKKKKKKVSE